MRVGFQFNINEMAITLLDSNGSPYFHSRQYKNFKELNTVIIFAFNWRSSSCHVGTAARDLQTLECLIRPLSGCVGGYGWYLLSPH